MQQAGVDADDELRAGDQPGDLHRAAPAPAPARPAAWPRCARCARARPRCPTAAPLEPARRELASERDPIRFRPLLGEPRRGVQQHGVALARLRKARALEPEVRLALRRVAERQAAQDAVARDRMLLAADRVAPVVEPRRQRLADAGGVVAVAAPMRQPRDHGRAHQPLAVDDLVVAMRPDRAQIAGDLGERRRRRRATCASAARRPAPRRSTAGCSLTSGAKASSTSQENRACGSALRASVTAGM